MLNQKTTPAADFESFSVTRLWLLIKRELMFFFSVDACRNTFLAFFSLFLLVSLIPLLDSLVSGVSLANTGALDILEDESFDILLDFIFIFAMLAAIFIFYDIGTKNPICLSIIQTRILLPAQLSEKIMAEFFLLVLILPIMLCFAYFIPTVPVAIIQQGVIPMEGYWHLWQQYAVAFSLLVAVMAFLDLWKISPLSKQIIVFGMLAVFVLFLPLGANSEGWGLVDFNLSVFVSHADIDLRGQYGRSYWLIGDDAMHSLLVRGDESAHRLLFAFNVLLVVTSLVLVAALWTAAYWLRKRDAPAD